MEEYRNCSVCPRSCGTDRTECAGFCGETDKLRIARAALHMWEEPCISGKEGSGTVFFEGCNLRCVFCQNYDIAHSERGQEISEDRLIEIFYELREKGANNINLVTPTHFTPTVARCIEKAKKNGFNLPFVWNSGGYETEESIKSLNGLVDVFLPDFKYRSDELAKKYSSAPDYFKTAAKALDAMYETAGKCEFDGRGIIKKGVVIRHLVLPGCYRDSIDVIRHIYSRYGDNVYISIMNQYTPMKTNTCPELSRKVTTFEYEKVLDAARELGIRNCYVQDGEAVSESFIPDFDLTGVNKA